MNTVTMDRGAGLLAKDAGQQLAIQFADEWRDDVIGELRAWCLRQRASGHVEMTFEQFRAQARCQPKSHKAWGALPRIAMGAGLIEPMCHEDGSPKMRAAESEKTHAHPVRVWRIKP